MKKPFFSNYPKTPRSSSGIEMNPSIGAEKGHLPGSTGTRCPSSGVFGQALLRLKSAVSEFRSVCAIGQALIVSMPGFSEQGPVLEFRDTVRVTGPEIRLGDLLTEMERGNDVGRLVVGESAPPGYSRHVDTRDLLSYNLQSRGLGLRVLAHKRIVVKTVAHAFRVSDFNDEILSHLESRISWPENSWTVRLIDSARVFRAYRPDVTVSLSRVPARPLGATSIRLHFFQQDDTVDMDIRCCFAVESPVLVASSDLTRGTTLSPANVRLEKKELRRSMRSPFVNPAEIQGFELKRSVKAGTVLDERMVARIPTVREGDLVTVSLEKKDFAILLNARARESGVIGEHILVENLASHKLLKVLVAARGVTVLAGREGI